MGVLAQQPEYQSHIDWAANDSIVIRTKSLCTLGRRRSPSATIQKRTQRDLKLSETIFEPAKDRFGDRL